MGIWVTFRLPIKLAVGRIVEMHGEGSMMTTRLHRSIDEAYGVQDITDYIFSRLGCCSYLKFVGTFQKVHSAPEARTGNINSASAMLRIWRPTCHLILTFIRRWCFFVNGW